MSAALVVGFVVPASAETEGAPVETSQSSRVAVADVPVLESAPLDEPLAATPVAPAESDAPLDASVGAPSLPPGKASKKSHFNWLTSTISERGANFNTYRNADGTHTSKVSLDDTNVKDALGKWVPIETGIGMSKTGSAAVKNHPLAPTFARSANGAAVFTATAGKRSVSFSLEGAGNSTLREGASQKLAARDAPEDAINYAEVFPGVDLQYEVQRTQVQEVLVVNDTPVDAPEYRWRITAPGLSLHLDEFSDYELREADGTVVFTVPAPTMWDSSAIEGVQESALTMVDTTIEEDADGWVMVLRPSMEWLTEKGRRSS